MSRQNKRAAKFGRRHWEPTDKEIWGMEISELEAWIARTFDFRCKATFRREGVR